MISMASHTYQNDNLLSMLRVSLHYLIITSKCSYNHQQSRKRHMKIRDHTIGHSKIIRRKMNLLVQPSKTFKCPSVLTALSTARITVVPTAQTLRPSSLARFTRLTASSPTCICSESILCLVRSSTSMSRKLPSPACIVTNAKSIPLISRRFINSRLKCKLLLEQSRPFFTCKYRLKRSASSSSTGRLIMVCGSGVFSNA